MTFPLLPLLPLMIIAATLVLSMVAISVRRSHRATFCLTLSGILAALAGLVALLPVVPVQAGLLFLFDGFALFYSTLVLAAGFLVAVLSYDYLEGRNTAPEEFTSSCWARCSGPSPLSAPAISSPFSWASKY